MNGEKNSKVVFRDVSQHSAKDKAAHMDVNLSMMAQKQQRIQDSMIIPNFQDRFKTIIASALKDSSRVDECGESSEKVKENVCSSAASIISPSRNGFSEMFNKEPNESPESHGGSSVKYPRNLPNKSKAANFINLTPKEYKSGGNNFKHVELSDPEVSSSLTNAAYSPISPSRTPPSSSSPAFQIQESLVKSSLGGYTIDLGLSVNRSMLSHEYHSKRVSASNENIAECSELGMRESSKNDSMIQSHNKDSLKSVSISPFSHIIEQSKSKQTLDDLKGKNGYSVNSRSHSHQSSSSVFRDEEYSRKFKSKYHSPHDIIKDRRSKHRSGSFHVSKSGKKDVSYSKSSRSGSSSKFESKRSSSKHGYSSKCKYYYFLIFYIL